VPSQNTTKNYDRTIKEHGTTGMTSPTGGAWKALKTGLTSNNMVSPKEIKDSASFFKSPKYISVNKSEVLKPGAASNQKT
jgi:hypothetical protein